MIFKNKIPATSVRQNPFSKLSHVSHIRWLSYTFFHKTLTSHKSLIYMCNTLPTKAAPPSPSVGASTHTHSTLLTLSSLLRVKGLTRWWYG
jgi:hypothetical protein